MFLQWLNLYCFLMQNTIENSSYKQKTLDTQLHSVAAAQHLDHSIKRNAYRLTQSVV